MSNSIEAEYGDKYRDYEGVLELIEIVRENIVLTDYHSQIDWYNIFDSDFQIAIKKKKKKKKPNIFKRMFGLILRNSPVGEFLFTSILICFAFTVYI